jgi:hypothetical protein
LFHGGFLCSVVYHPGQKTKKAAGGLPAAFIIKKLKSAQHRQAGIKKIPKIKIKIVCAAKIHHFIPIRIIIHRPYFGGCVKGFNQSKIHQLFFQGENFGGFI